MRVKCYVCRKKILANKQPEEGIFTGFHQKLNIEGSVSCLFNGRLCYNCAKAVYVGTNKKAFKECF